MKKKLIVLLAVLTLSAAAYATPLLQVGPMVSYNHSVVELSDQVTEGTLSINNFTFGADVRVNLFSWISIDVPAGYGFASSDGEYIGTFHLNPSLNLNIPAASFLDIALGVGCQMDFSHNGSFSTWWINGHRIDQFGNAMLGSTLNYRLALTFNLGFISIGASATVPMAGTFENFNMTPDFTETRVSLACLFNLL